VYAERYSALGIRLYITKIQDGDDGIYTCKARVQQQQQQQQQEPLMLEQDTKMFLYGQLTVHHRRLSSV